MVLEVMAKARTPIPLDVSFQVEPGELMALVGPSGSGKTTILRTIAGLWKPECARVRVDIDLWLDTAAGVDVPTHRRRLGMVFQSYALFPHMTTEANVATAIDDLPGGTARRAEARRLLELVNLSGLEMRYPAELSGGQRQRVAIARALARKPKALLLDEPFSAVDRATREVLYSEIASIRAHLDMPMILVTHDINEARMLADCMLVIEHGSTLRAGSAAEVLADPNMFPLLGRYEAGSIITATVGRHDHADGLSELHFGGGRIIAPLVAAEPGTTLRIRVRARDIIIALRPPQDTSALNILPATVREIGKDEAAIVDVSLRSGSTDLLARITRRSLNQLGLRPGTECYAILKSVAVGRRDMGVLELRGD